MDVERLIRSIDERLAHLSESDRAEVADAVREGFGRERRFAHPSLTVESEREKRQEAEAMRAVLEGIVRQARFEETIDEVLKQLDKVVTFDSCSLALLEAGPRFRIVATRGYEEPGKLIGLRYSDELTEAILQGHQSLAVNDVKEDSRYQPVELDHEVRSWAGIPLLVEGEMIGIVSLNRKTLQPFDDDELHRARSVAFSAAAAIRKARLLEQVQRYASVQEWLVSLYEDVLEGRSAGQVAQRVLEGALRLGYPGGAMVALGHDDKPAVVAAAGEGFDGIVGRSAPAELMGERSGRIESPDSTELVKAIGATLGVESVYLVPLSTADQPLGCLMLIDTTGEEGTDALTEAYASRAALAWRHVFSS